MKSNFIHLIYQKLQELNSFIHLLNLNEATARAEARGFGSLA